MFDRQIEELLSYPHRWWGENPSDRWISLCFGMRGYHPPSRCLALGEQRKWELVSAFQKSIRRGDKRTALQLVSAIDSMSEECAYFWKRLCVIACEDIGPGDDVLASFVIACAAVFPPKATGTKNYDLFCFLAEQMCDLANRSRIYCSCGIIEAATVNSTLPELESGERPTVSTILEYKEAVQRAQTSWKAWQKKNDWRTAGLLRFLGLKLPLEMTQDDTPLPPSKTLFDLPSYCYDMYTRVGLTMLRRLTQGVYGAEGIKELFQENKIKSPHKTLGEALFFVEGGRIHGELFYEPLRSLEQRLFAHQYGLSLKTWLELQVLMAKALQDGIVDRLREEVLHQFYDGNLQLIAPKGGLIRQ
ncbi:MAG: hypothetical protein JWN74_1234 [Acidobacteriaceae bacterium]|nr:hypothetical protein [Acidobacteriaceae bacterium]